MAKLPTLTGADEPLIVIAPDVFLRPLHPQDVSESYVDGLNDSRVNQYISTHAALQTIESVRAFVQANWRASDGLLLGLFVGGRHCGNIRLHDLTAENCWLGVAIFDTSLHGRGLGSSAIRAATDHALASWGVARVSAGIDPTNVASQHSFRKAGFHHARPMLDGYNQMWIKVRPS